MQTQINRTSGASGNCFKLLGGFALSVSLGLFLSAGAQARDLAPEVLSRVWLDNGQQVAAVELNGQEIVRFQSDDDDDDDAAEEAEDLAVRLQELISDKKFDPSTIVPMRDEDRCSIKGDGDVILSFDPYAGQADNDTEEDGKRFSRAFDMATKVANALRTAFGVSPINLDIAEKQMSRLEMLGKQFTGAASWYGGRFNGRKCSDGTRFSEARMTAAHRSLPFGTKLLVKNRKTGDTCVVEVNDRGPFIDGRVIDVSKAAAKQLNMVSAGIAHVECTVLQ